MTESRVPFEGTPTEAAAAWQRHLVEHQAEDVTYDPRTGYGDTGSSFTESDGAAKGHGEISPGVRHLSPSELAAGLGEAATETTKANDAVKGDDGATSVVDGLTLDDIIDRADGQQ